MEIWILLLPMVYTLLDRGVAKGEYGGQNPPPIGQNLFGNVYQNSLEDYILAHIPSASALSKPPP